MESEEDTGIDTRIYNVLALSLLAEQELFTVVKAIYDTFLSCSSGQIPGQALYTSHST